MNALQDTLYHGSVSFKVSRKFARNVIRVDWYVAQAATYKPTLVTLRANFLAFIFIMSNTSGNSQCSLFCFASLLIM